MTSREPLAIVQGRVIAAVRRHLPQLPEQAVAVLLATARVRDRSWRELDTFLSAHTDAFTQHRSVVPRSFVRLAHTLVDAGHTVALPCCAKCGRSPRTFGKNTPDGRLCQMCAAQRERCTGCGTVARINLVTTDGRLCSSCSRNHPSRLEICGSCGQLRPVVVRAADGTPRCPSRQCYQAPHRTCSGCGIDRPVNRVVDGRPFCRDCRPTPPRRCGRCGNVATISVRATDTTPDLCKICAPGREGHCSGCGQQRRVFQSRTDNRLYCEACRSHPERECAGCGELKRVAANWPMGPVCVTCYARTIRHASACSTCGTVLPLVGRTSDGQPICGPCAGSPLTYACQRCGRTGDNHRADLCHRCALHDGVTELLRGPDGVIPQQLHPLHATLTNATHAITTLTWLNRSPAAALLRDLTSAGTITHELLDQQPQTLALHYVRDMLVSARVLPVRDEHLSRLEPWVRTTLADVPAKHARLVGPFARWSLLPRGRRASQRGIFTSSSAAHIRRQVRQALSLLSWLDTNSSDLATLDQAQLDLWLDHGASTRRNVGAFITWAQQRRLTRRDLQVPHMPPSEPQIVLEENDRLTQLAQCVNDDTIPLHVRAAGALTLLFAIPLSRILKLRQDKLVDRDGVTYLHIDDHLLLQPPRLAALLHQLAEDGPARTWTLQRMGPAGPWLFPGRTPDRPLSESVLRKHLHNHGIDTLAGRNSARMALATELPAAVLADLTGIGISTALRWSRWAQRDWLDYLTTREPHESRPS